MRIFFCNISFINICIIKFYSRKDNQQKAKSFTWILRSLWAVGEEVHDDALPNFLDSKAIDFVRKVRIFFLTNTEFP